MEQSCDIRVSGPSVEAVVCEGEHCLKAHIELFRMDAACYRLSGDDLLGSLKRAASEDVSKLHIAAGWEAMLRVSLWTQKKPSLYEVLGLLRKSGVSEAELAPFGSADINDLFPWLYYGKRFEILRKIANRAKSRAEAALEKKKLIVYCHLVAGDTGAIVASSL